MIIQQVEQLRGQLEAEARVLRAAAENHARRSVVACGERLAASGRLIEGARTAGAAPTELAELTRQRRELLERAELVAIALTPAPLATAALSNRDRRVF